MIIDIAYLAVLILALFKGYSKGFIVAVFSFFAIFIGLAAALKLSVLVAGWLSGNTSMGARLLPIVSFALVMLGIAVLVRFCALLIEKSLQLVMLGFINKLAGILLYIIIYTIVFSVLLFFAEETSMVRSETIDASHFYSFVQPWGPKAINSIGTVIPWFQNMFQQLEQFFDRMAKNGTAYCY